MCVGLSVRLCVLKRNGKMNNLNYFFFSNNIVFSNLIFWRLIYLC